MNYSEIFWTDVINGEGLRVSLFTSGCTIRCPGCFNTKAWDFNAGKRFTTDTMVDILKHVFNDKINYSGLSLLGGEPLDNMEGLIPLLEEFNRMNKVKNADKNVWIWSGRDLDEILKDEKKVDFLFKYCDTIVTGPFIEDLKDLTLKFRGSSNQKIYTIDKEYHTFTLREDL